MAVKPEKRKFFIKLLPTSHNETMSTNVNGTIWRTLTTDWHEPEDVEKFHATMDTKAKRVNTYRYRVTGVERTDTLAERHHCSTARCRT
jgi:hypothetical protein